MSSSLSPLLPAASAPSPPSPSPPKKTNTSVNFKLLRHLLHLVYFSVVYPRSSDSHFRDESGVKVPESGENEGFLYTSYHAPRRTFLSRHIANIFRLLLNTSFLIFNILIELAKTNVSYQLSLSMGQTTGALVSGFQDHFSTDSWNHFLSVLLVASLWIVATAALKTVHYFVIEQMMILWRYVLVSNLHRVYFADKRFYWSTDLVKNVDQRIQADTETYVDLWRKIMQDVMGAPMSIVMFSYHSFLICGWQGPAAVYAYFIGGIIVNKVLIGPVAKRWDLQKEKEGNFRFAHATVRSYAESVALLQGGPREKNDCDTLLGKVVRNRGILSILEVFLNFHMNLFGYCGGILNYAIIAVCAFYLGTFKADDVASFSALIGTASYQMLAIIFGFTTIVQVGGYFSELTGIIGRLGLFLDSMKSVDSLQKRAKTDNSEHMTLSESVCDTIATLDNEFFFYNFSLFDPKQNVLVECIPEFTIRRGMHTLIAGNSGAGKSTLVRTLSDMWPYYTGMVIKPRKQSVYVIPQNSYCSIGTLRDQITYPLKDKAKKFGTVDADHILVSCIKRARLSYLIERADFDWNTEENWPRILSGGERQRLAFCRLFYKYAMYGADSVQWVIMDESTSSLDVETEEKIMNEVLQLHDGITIISVGHRPTLKKFHRYTLKLGVGPNGTGYSFGETSQGRQKI